MGQYAHFTISDRNILEGMQFIGSAQKHIANATSKTEGAISYELKKNSCPDGSYSADYAEAQAKQRRKKSKPRVVLADSSVTEYIETKLPEGWSPEQISGRGKNENPPVEVSTESIYEYIYLPENSEKKLWEYLRRSHKRRKRRKLGRSSRKGCNIPNRVSIHKRPAIVDERSRLGDFEGDSIVGPRQGNDGALATFNDRKSGLVLIAKMERKSKAEMCKAACQQLKRIPKAKRHTLTLDNGTEFTCHEAISCATDIKTFFADPYSSWQRGSNENTNGLIRQYFPKGTSFKDVTQEDVEKIAHLLNNRPRKRLGYKTPYEVFFANTQLSRKWD